MSSSRRSIIKKTKTGRDTTAKRLSFQPSPPQKTATEEQNNESDISQLGSAVAPVDPACRMTLLGLCYDPTNAPTRMLKQHDSVSMKYSQRNHFASALNFTTATGTTANVLIAGEKIFGEKLKAYLLEAHHKQLTTQGLKWRMNLDISCEKTLTPVLTKAAHFIIILLTLDTHESIMNLSKFLRSYTEDILPSKRIMVITLSSALGCSRNVVDLDQFHTLLSSYNLVHFPWKEQGRLGQVEVKRILELMYKSVGYHRGSSLLTDYVMQLNINWL